jgi:di/tricarboxylate transporter
MTRDQAFSLILLGAMIGLFLWDRWRYDLVALATLLVAVFAGIVPPDHAFSGFANPVLALIGGALIVSAAVGQSGIVAILVRRLMPRLRGPDRQTGVLVACVVLLSAFMKNVGALAIFIPVAFQIARRSDRSAAELLMPLSFASLLGGSVTLIGTSPNMLTANLRQELMGEPFHMFDFTPVGLGVALVGTLFLAFAWRLLPPARRRPDGAARFRVEDYTSELAIAAGSPLIGRTLGEAEALGANEISVTALIRKGYHRQPPMPSATLDRDDVLVVRADPQPLAQFAQDGKLAVVGSAASPDELGADDPPAPGKREAAPQDEPPRGRLAVVEGVVTAGSELIGRSAAELQLRRRHRVNVLAIGRSGRRIGARLHRVRFQPGDAIVFQGRPDTIHESLAALGVLPLAERQLALGRPRRPTLPLVILGVTMLASGLELVPVAIAFVAAALAVIICGLLTPRDAYGAVEWPILVLLGALIPVGEAVKTTGTTDLLAGLLAGFAAHLPGWGILAMILVTTMLATPILHHAPAVLVMGPIAAGIATRLGYHADPFLMAVALGAGSDFLSPIGHQSNTLVMGPGGYRFGDYWHLGLPLSALVVAVGVPLILFFWPLG